LFAVLDEEVMMGRTENIRDLAEPIVAAAGLELWDVEVASGLVRVLVDQPAGVGLEALSAASRALSAALDEHDDVVGSGRYDLEVSSPGIERTLRTPEHYRRYVGTEIAVKISPPVEGSRRFRGTLVEVTPTGIALSLGDEEGRSVALGYPDIQRAHVVAVWGPTAPPGKTAPPARPAHTDRARPRAGAARGSATAGARAGSGPAPEPKDA
jgi:ribosome maturation factor RimP